MDINLIKSYTSRQELSNGLCFLIFTYVQHVRVFRNIWMVRRLPLDFLWVLTQFEANSSHLQRYTFHSFHMMFFIFNVHAFSYRLLSARFCCCMFLDSQFLVSGEGNLDSTLTFVDPA